MAAWFWLVGGTIWAAATRPSLVELVAWKIRPRGASVAQAAAPGPGVHGVGGALGRS